MKKHNTRALLVLLSCGAASNLAHAESNTVLPTVEQIMQEKNATIDLTLRYFNSIDCMRSSKKGQQETQAIEIQRQQMTMEIKRMQEEITTFAKDLQQQAAALSDTARDKKQQEIVKMNRDYENKLKDCDEQLKLAMQQVTDRLSRDVEVAVSEYAQANDIDVMADSITGRVVYVSERAQCTRDIIALMDSKQVMSEGMNAVSKKTVS